MNWINFQHIQRFLIGAILLAGLCSCGADEDQEVEDSIDVALSYLTAGDCQRAINTLEDVGRHPRNYRYVKTLASGYACRAGYSTPLLYGTDISKIGTPSILGGMTTFTTSDLMVSPDDPNYEDMQEAINILLFSGGITDEQNPTTERRQRYFSLAEVANLDLYIVYLSMVQLGMYLNFYGKIDNALVSTDGDFGKKGGNVGAGAADAADFCLFEYDGAINLTGDGTIVTVDMTLDQYLGVLGATGNSCSGTTVGAADTYNPYLGSNNNMHIERMCQGVVLLNTFFNSLDNVISTVSGDGFGDLGDSFNQISDINDIVATVFPDTVNLIGLMNQQSCEDLFSDGTSANTEALQVFFALYYEALFD